MVWLFLLLLSGCVAPAYQDTTYGMDEFTIDSQQIAEGKFAILALEEKEEICYPEPHGFDDDVVIEGDELSIILYCPSRRDRVSAMEMINVRAGFPVQDGKICLPHLSLIEVSGLTLSEVKERVQCAYQEEIPDAKIYIHFKKKRERIVQIVGAAIPNVTVDGNTRLFEVIAKARISPHANLFKSYVMRDGVQLPIDLYALIHQGESSQNIVMQGGDKIFIATDSDAVVMLTGEIAYPLVVPVPYGSISLREALGRAGGVPFTGNKNNIQVIRGGLTHPKVYCLEWKDILHVPNQSLLLMAGDVVVISERPITQWNRFINQLQPNVGCVETAFVIYEAMRH